MINAKLQDFAASAMARGQISFGDVRRLQRDCLPQGITTREDAESLIALNATLVRADRAWAAWLVPALADFATAQQAADVSGADESKAWLQGLLKQSPSSVALGRKIARHIRRQHAQSPADESTEATKPRRRPVRTCKLEALRQADAAKKMAAIVQSEIEVPPSPRAAVRRKRTATRAIIVPCEIWSAGIMEKHLRFQLARPVA